METNRCLCADARCPCRPGLSSQHHPPDHHEGDTRRPRHQGQRSLYIHLCVGAGLRKALHQPRRRDADRGGRQDLRRSLRSGPQLSGSGLPRRHPGDLSALHRRRDRRRACPRSCGAVLLPGPAAGGQVCHRAVGQRALLQRRAAGRRVHGVGAA